MNSSRAKILSRLQETQHKRGGQHLARPDFKSPIYPSLEENLVDCFQANLELIGGKVLRIENLNGVIPELKKLIKSEKLEHLVCLEPEIQDVLKGDIAYKKLLDNFEHIGVGITTCEYLVAHLGSILVSSASRSGRRLTVFPECHIVLASKDQLVSFLDDALTKIEEKYPDRLPSMITNISGPSRTADIEKTLVMGMHGPKKLFVLLADELF
ncbi:LutC/YkgG family protein [Sunxiuqinia indica]|uniref:LutC/YkgG family protein n=1 Tax=Sunxiuqinia indica TaxID=2692584 RepID=UPI00135AE601|nr:lactate utilization protein [Sunxiuqinia indica]